jgi:hypothetical protein
MLCRVFVSQSVIQIEQAHLVRTHLEPHKRGQKPRPTSARAPRPPGEAVRHGCEAHPNSDCPTFGRRNLDRNRQNSRNPARRQDTTVSGFTTIRALVQRTRGLRRPLRERAGPSLQDAEEHSVHYHLFKATNSWKGSRKPKQNWPNFVR